MDFNSLKDNKTFRTIMGVVVFFLVVFVIYKIYSGLKEKAKKRPYLVKGPKDATEPLTLDASKILPSEIGNEFSFSFWVYVKDWGHNFSLPKHVFHIGDATAQSVFPGVWLYPKNNNLMVRMDTYNRFNNVSKTKTGNECQNWTSNYPHKNESYNARRYPNADLGNHNFCRNPDGRAKAWCFTQDPDMETEECDLKDHRIPASMNPKVNKHMFDHQKECDLVNIPVQRWVHIVITLNNKTLDVYLNGKLSRSCTLEEVPKIGKGDVFINQDGGYNGELSDLLYVNQCISVTEIYNLYLSGPSRFTLYDKLGDYEPKVNLNVNVSVSANAGNDVPVEDANN